MGRNYPRLTVTDFGRHLFKSGDLDPVYVALNAARGAVPGESDWTPRWLIAYWCFYHAGAASYIAQFEPPDFWLQLSAAAQNLTVAPTGDRWPRGSERRHFRGYKCVDAVDELSKRYGPRPGDMIEFLCEGPTLTVPGIMERAKRHPMFGNWIAFKVADMIDAILDRRVDQSDVHAFLYDTPRQSIWQHLNAQDRVGSLTDNDYLEAMYWLRDELIDCRVPHHPAESPDWFSLETVWCKHLSHLHGHYPIDKDTAELHHGVAPWKPLSPLAEAFRAGLPSYEEPKRYPQLW